MRNQRLEAEAARIQTNIDNLLSTIFQEPIARVNNSVAISRVLDTARTAPTARVLRRLLPGRRLGSVRGSRSRLDPLRALCRRRVDRFAHYPCMLADLALRVKPYWSKELDGSAEQESPLRLAAGGDLGYGLDAPAPEL